MAGEAETLILILLAFIFPPAAVAFVSGCGADLCFNILLTLLGYLPGCLHAFWIVFKRAEANERYGYGNWTYKGMGAYDALDASQTGKQRGGQTYVQPQGPGTETVPAPPGPPPPPTSGSVSTAAAPAAGQQYNEKSPAYTGPGTGTGTVPPGPPPPPSGSVSTAPAPAAAEQQYNEKSPAYTQPLPPPAPVEQTYEYKAMPQIAPAGDQKQEDQGGASRSAPGTQ